MTTQHNRNLIDVLNKLKLHIPDDQITFKEDIENALHSAAFSPPEIMHIHWQTTQHIISEKFKIYKEITDIPPWAHIIIKIWTDNI